EAGRGDDPGGHPGRTRTANGRSAEPAEHRLAGGAGAGVRPRQGSDPPGPQAVQRHGGRLRRGPGHGLGPRHGAVRGRRRRLDADGGRAGLPHHPTEEMYGTARSGATGGFGAETEAVWVLGTPAYMPPEQANGDVANLDRRCDVFGLGAILCEVLTGDPPYVGRSAEEVRRRAAAGDLADALAALDGCGADAELVALTRRCLAAERAVRPADGREVADALSAHLDGGQDRLRAAERERAAALAREAEQRKRRRVQLALAAALLLLLLGGGAFAWWQSARL